MFEMMLLLKDRWQYNLVNFNLQILKFILYQTITVLIFFV